MEQMVCDEEQTEEGQTGRLLEGGIARTNVPRVSSLWGLAEKQM